MKLKGITLQFLWKVVILAYSITQITKLFNQWMYMKQLWSTDNCICTIFILDEM